MEVEGRSWEGHGGMAAVVAGAQSVLEGFGEATLLFVTVDLSFSVVSIVRLHGALGEALHPASPPDPVCLLRKMRLSQFDPPHKTSLLEISHFCAEANFLFKYHGTA